MTNTNWTHSFTDPSGNIVTIDGTTARINALFNENYFRTKAPTSSIQAMDYAIAQGHYQSAYQYWILNGISAGFAPNKYYNEETYLSANPDVKAAVRGQALVSDTTAVFLNSGLEHWVAYGIDQMVTSSYPRSSAALVPTYALLTTTDTYTADSSIGVKFTASETTFLAGDALDGSASNLSSMTLSLGGSPASAGSMTNVGTVDITASASSTLDNTNIIGVTSFIDDSSSAALTLNKLPNNAATITMKSTSYPLTANYLDAALTGNLNAVNVALSGITNAAATVLSFTNTAAGYFKTLNIASNGAVANALWNSATYFQVATSGLAGSALVGTSVLNITGSTPFQTAVASAVNTIRTVTAAPVTTLQFIDTTTGTTSNGVTATFASAGSKIGFSAAALATTGNSITFTGAGNTLALKVAAAATTSSLGSQFTNVDSLEVTNTLTGSTINLNNIDTNAIKNVYIDVPAAVTAVVNNFADSTTSSPNSLTIGLHSQAPVAITSLTTSQVNAATTNQLNVNLLGTGAGATQTLTLNGVGSTAVYVDPSITGGFSLSLYGNELANATVTGGLSSSLITFSAIPAGLNSLDASASSSGISVTGNNAISTVKGSFTAANTITGGTLADTIVGGAAADTIDPGMGANTVTLHHVESNVGNVVKFTNYNAVTTIADFNAGTSSTAVDTIAFSRAPTSSNAGGGAIVKLVKGTAAAVTAAAAVVQVVTTSSAATDISALTTSVVVLNNGQTYANAAALSTYLTTAGTKFVVSAITHSTASAMPFFYQNTNGGVSIAIVDFPDAATDSTAVNVLDVATLGNTVNPVLISNIDATDIANFY
ncbi:hypothetical protein SZ25_00446 [Candidatus Arcanobacter lacustris]|uniref:Uncharacterized protein n=1 Tax=Candidatus Arcanibacter lacustris TaxID=1607817 RepID=A0A0F5MP37_9RICK|nr:hypothetical protein SZ25_00446 [Candidatus Arcanobacter lacustris]